MKYRLKILWPRCDCWTTLHRRIIVQLITFCTASSSSKQIMSSYWYKSFPYFLTSLINNLSIPQPLPKTDFKLISWTRAIVPTVSNQQMKNACEIQTRTIKKKYFKNKFFERNTMRDYDIDFFLFMSYECNKKKLVVKIKNILFLVSDFKMLWLRFWWKKKKCIG